MARLTEIKDVETHLRKALSDGSFVFISDNKGGSLLIRKLMCGLRDRLGPKRWEERCSYGKVKVRNIQTWRTTDVTFLTIPCHKGVRKWLCTQGFSWPGGGRPRSRYRVVTLCLPQSGEDMVAFLHAAALGLLTADSSRN
jgi:hypothetical protein